MGSKLCDILTVVSLAVEVNLYEAICVEYFAPHKSVHEKIPMTPACLGSITKLVSHLIFGLPDVPDGFSPPD
jgi:hypothetical protein